VKAKSLSELTETHVEMATDASIGKKPGRERSTKKWEKPNHRRIPFRPSRVCSTLPARCRTRVQEGDCESA
jgi:hypothetical protein